MLRCLKMFAIGPSRTYFSARCPCDSAATSPIAAPCPTAALAGLRRSLENLAALHQLLGDTGLDDPGHAIMIRIDAAVVVMGAILDTTADTSMVGNVDRITQRIAAVEHVAKLTSRQHQVMELVLAGHPSKNIASDLRISQRTVENHRASIMRKTGAKSIPALARMAVAAAGFVPAE